MGMAKVKRVTSPLYHDRWMAEEIRADVELHQDIDGLVAEVWLPDDYQGTMDVVLSFGEASTRIAIGGGLSSIPLRAPHTRGVTVPLSLVAEETRTAAPNDPRQVSVILDSIRLVDNLQGARL